MTVYCEATGKPCGDVVRVRMGNGSVIFVSPHVYALLLMGKSISEIVSMEEALENQLKDIDTPERVNQFVDGAKRYNFQRRA